MRSQRYSAPARRSAKARHLCRYILTGVYTGSRSEVILNLRFMPHVGGGWVDTDTGVLYRRAAGECRDKETDPARAGPAPPARTYEAMGAPGRPSRGGSQGRPRSVHQDGLAFHAP